MYIYWCDLDAADARFCVAESHKIPYRYELAGGQPAAALMRERGDEAMRLDLDEDEGGLELPDLVANVDNLLILHQRCATMIHEAHDLGEHEVVPAVLVNSKGRVHCPDYVVVNPLGMVDCLDTDRSEMDGVEAMPSVKLFGKFWLDASRIPPGRDLFRVRGVLTGYMFSEQLVAFIREQGFTNFVFQEVPLS